MCDSSDMPDVNAEFDSVYVAPVQPTPQPSCTAGQVYVDFSEKDESQRAALDDHPNRNVRIACCITIYNEPAGDIAESMLGLLRSYLNMGAFHVGWTSELEICLVIDGVEALSPSAREFLIQKKFVVEPLPQVRPDETCDDVMMSMRYLAPCGDYSSSTLESAAEIFPTLVDWSERSSPLLRVLTCIKPKNAGKLHSHWCFFNLVAPLIQPDYVLQMDVGTVTDDSCVGALVELMESERDCAAAAAAILVAAPERCLSLLDAWQFGDFLNQKINDWPVGSLLGHLEVVPGPCSMLRYAALVAENESDQNAIGSSPLQRYFRGLNSHDFLTRVLFLAEDRVLGFELNSQSGHLWKTRYVKKAIATADKCASLDELLRQRRRWINSSNAARLWRATRAKALFINKNSTLADRSSFTASLVWSLLTMLLELLMPLISLAYSVAGISNFLNVLFPHLEAGLNTGCPAFVIVLWLTQVVLCRISRRCRSAVRTLAAVTCMQGALSVASLAGMLLTGASLWSISIIGMLSGLTMTVCVVAFSPKLLKTWHIWAIIHPALTAILQPLLVTYAVVNLDDATWGTKGKTAGSNEALNVTVAAVVLLWISLTVAALICFEELSAGHRSALFAGIGALLLVRQMTGMSCHLANVIMSKVQLMPRKSRRFVDPHGREQAI